MGFWLLLLLVGVDAQSSQCLASDCGICVGATGCVWCPRAGICLDGLDYSESECPSRTDVVHFSGNCASGSPSQNVGVPLGISVGCMVVFLIVTCVIVSRKKLENASTTIKALYAKHNIVDINFASINLEAFREDGKKAKFLWILSMVLSAHFFWSMGSDIWAIYSVMQQNSVLACIYALFVFISLVLFALEIREGLAILKTDDVSDCFLNSEAHRFRTNKSRLTHNFFKLVEKQYKCTDKFALRTFFILKDAKRLILVDLGQLLLSGYMLLVELPNKCEQEGISSGCVPILEMVGLIFKAILSAFAMWMFSLHMLIYPCIRLYLATAYKKEGGENFSLRSYATYKVDKAIQKLLKETPGAVDDDFFPEAEEKQRIKIANQAKNMSNKVTSGIDKANAAGKDAIAGASAAIGGVFGFGKKPDKNVASMEEGTAVGANGDGGDAGGGSVDVAVGVDAGYTAPPPTADAYVAPAPVR